MAVTNTTTQEPIMYAEWIAPALAAARAKGIFMPGMIGRSLPGIEFKDLTGLRTTVASFEIENYFTARDVSQSEDYVIAEAYTPTAAIVTVTEKIAIEVITKMAAKTADQDPVLRSGRMLGQALAEKFSGDVYALHDSFDHNSATSGSAATWALLTAARNRLETNNYGGPYIAIVKPRQYYDIVSTATVVTSAGGLQDDILRSYEVAELAGIQIIRDPLVASSNSAADWGGAVYSGRPAVGIAILWEMEPDMDHDASARLDEFVATMCFGVGEIDGAAAEEFSSLYA